jgi:hypothetical protein
MLNGWQCMQKLEGNSLACIGTQVNFSPSEKITWNWNTFIGTDDPKAKSSMRYFNNLLIKTSMAINLQKPSKNNALQK